MNLGGNRGCMRAKITSVTVSRKEGRRWLAGYATVETEDGRGYCLIDGSINGIRGEYKTGDKGTVEWLACMGGKLPFFTKS